MNYEKLLNIGEMYVVQGQPFLVRTDLEDYFWDDCKALSGQTLQLKDLCESTIPILTHRHVDSRFQTFMKLVFSDVAGTDYHFHSDDVVLSQTF